MSSENSNFGRVLATLPVEIKRLIPDFITLVRPDAQSEEAIRRLLGSAVRGLPFRGESAFPKPAALTRHPEIARLNVPLTVRRTIIFPEGRVNLEFEQFPGKQYTAGFFGMHPKRETLRAVVLEGEGGDVWAVELLGDNLGGDIKVAGKCRRLAGEVRASVQMDCGLGDVRSLIGRKGNLLLLPMDDGRRRVDAVFDPRLADARDVELARQELSRVEALHAPPVIINPAWAEEIAPAPTPPPIQSKAPWWMVLIRKIFRYYS